MHQVAQVWTYIFTVADPAMGGQGGRPPIDQNLGLAMAARLRHGKFLLKSLTLWPLFCVKMYKKLCPWTPLGALPPDPRLGSHALAMVPPWQILDPPLQSAMTLSVILNPARGENNCSSFGVLTWAGFNVITDEPPPRAGSKELEAGFGQQAGLCWPLL